MPSSFSSHFSWRFSATAILLVASCSAIWLLRDGHDRRVPDERARAGAVSRARATSRGIDRRALREPPGRAPGLAFAGALEVPSGMPKALRPASRQTLQEPMGSTLLRLSQARRLVTSSHKVLWLVPRGRQLCLFRVVRMAATCAPFRRVHRYGLVVETYLLSSGTRPIPSHFMMVGIAPDGVYAVRAVVAGHSRTIPVEENVFQMQDRKPINVVRLLRRVH